MIRMSVPVSKSCVAKLCLSVWTVTRLSMPAARARRAAGGIQHLHIDGAMCVPAGKQPALRLRQPPVDPQDAQKLGRQHYGATLAALAVLDPDHAAPAIDVADLQPEGLRGAKARGVGCRQGRAAQPQGGGQPQRR